MAPSDSEYSEEDDDGSDGTVFFFSVLRFISVIFLFGV